MTSFQKNETNKIKKKTASPAIRSIIIVDIEQRHNFHFQKAQQVFVGAVCYRWLMRPVNNTSASGKCENGTKNTATKKKTLSTNRIVD